MVSNIFPSKYVHNVDRQCAYKRLAENNNVSLSDVLMNTMGLRNLIPLNSRKKHSNSNSGIRTEPVEVIERAVSGKQLKYKQRTYYTFSKRSPSLLCFSSKFAAAPKTIP